MENPPLLIMIIDDSRIRTSIYEHWEIFHCQVWLPKGKVSGLAHRAKPAGRADSDWPSRGAEGWERIGKRVGENQLVFVFVQTPNTLIYTVYVNIINYV